MLLSDAHWLWSSSSSSFMGTLNDEKLMSKSTCIPSKFWSYIFLYCDLCSPFVNSFIIEFQHFLYISSGKTYTMVGTRDDPGLMVLSLHTIFDLIKSNKSSDEFEVTCSYLEVYNEVRVAFWLRYWLIYIAHVLSKLFDFFISNKFRSSMICSKNHLDIWSLERILSRE